MSAYIAGTFSADGNSNEIILEKKGMVFCGSTAAQAYGGGVITVQFKDPSGVWHDSVNTIDEANVLSIDVAIPTPVRLSLAGATSPDIDYVIESDLSYVATAPDAA